MSRIVAERGRRPPNHLRYFEIPVAVPVTKLPQRVYVLGGGEGQSEYHALFKKDPGTTSLAGRHTNPSHDGRCPPITPVFQRHVAGERLGLEPELLPSGHPLAMANPEGLVN